MKGKSPWIVGGFWLKAQREEGKMAWTKESQDSGTSDRMPGPCWKGLMGV